ncbi:MAG: isopentenyl-diphosphate Delta-isomerase [Candidatus Peregrinibacteria bacterium]
MSTVLLVDENGHPLNSMDRAKAHESPGLLHRAFSIFVFRHGRKELLIQQRAEEKLFGLLWCNTCCSHLQEEEDLLEAGSRRLKEELGFTCPLKEGASFVYRAEDPNGKGAEYEYDTILKGSIEGEPPVTPREDEVRDWQWIDTEGLTVDMHRRPLLYAPWFHLAFPMVMR